eukprot:16973-Heterococcus_DN1.PRE.1
MFLRDPGILQHIFTFLPGHWLFLGAVCREWEAVYASMAEQQVCNLSLYGSFKSAICAKHTLYSAAVAAPATTKLASSCGLTATTGYKNVQLQHIAGLYAGIETLAVLRELGMPISERVNAGVATSGRLDVLQHLLTEPACPRPTLLSLYAARSGSISMLQWLKVQTWCTFDTFTCTGAAQRGQLAALKHLRSEGCEWIIVCEAARAGSIEQMQWLRQQQGIEITALTLAYAADRGQTT